MLNAGDRKRLAPELATLEKAEAGRAEIQEALAAARQALTEVTARTTFVDRHLGCFSRDRDLSRAFSRARREHDRLIRRLADHEVSARAAEKAFFDLLSPILSKRDPQFRKLIQAEQDCGRAREQCRLLADQLGIAQGSVQAVISGTTANAALEAAGLRYEQAIRQARDAMPDLRRPIDDAYGSFRAGAGRAGTAGTKPPMPDLYLFKRLPTDGFTAGERHRLRSAKQPLDRLVGQVDTIVATLGRWEAAVEAARIEALRAARARL